MKKKWTGKRLLWIVLLFFFVLGMGKMDTLASDAVLGIHAFGDAGGKASSGNQGHTWLTIENTSSGYLYFCGYRINRNEIISVSIWPDSTGYKNLGGVYINREQVVEDGQWVASHYEGISKEQLAKISAATPSESYYHDGQEDSIPNLRDDLWHNCTTYSTKMWNMAVGKDKKISDGTMGVDVPGTVAEKIMKLGNSTRHYYTVMSKRYWKDVYYVYANGNTECLDSMTISETSLTLKISGEKKLNASYEYSTDANSDIKWFTSNSKVATVDKNGNVKAVGAGTCTITACSDAPDIVRIYTKCEVEVKKDNKLKLSTYNVTLTEGQCRTISASMGGKNVKATWKSSNKKVVTVSSGKLKGRKKGTATITVTIKGYKAKCSVTVVKKKAAKTDYAAYRRFLEEGTFSYRENKTNRILNINYFCLLDIDGNGKKELITASDKYGARSIYSLSGTTVKWCGSYSSYGNPNVLYSKKNRGIMDSYSHYNLYEGYTWYQMYHLRSGKLKKGAYAQKSVTTYGGKKEMFFAASGGGKIKKSAKKNFKAYEKKYVKTAKEYQFYFNSASNRQMICK